MKEEQLQNAVGKDGEERIQQVSIVLPIPSIHVHSCYLHFAKFLIVQVTN